MSVCHSRTLNKNRINRVLQSMEGNCTPRCNSIPSKQQSKILFTAHNGTYTTQNGSNETLPTQDGSDEIPPMQDRLNGIPPMQDRLNGIPNTQMTMRSEAPSELPEIGQSKDTSVGLISGEILLQRSLKENVVSEGPDKLKYFCHPCGTEILGLSNIHVHLLGKKHSNSSFYEVMKNPILAPSVLKDLVPKVALDATLSQQVLCLSATTYQCGRCQKVLNGVKPLVHHLEFHRCNMLTMLITARASGTSTLAFRESFGSELQTPKLPKNIKVVLFEYAIERDNRSAHVENLTECFKFLGLELKCFQNLSSTAMNKYLERLSSSKADDDEIDSFLFVLTGSGYDQTFYYNSQMETVTLADVVDGIDEHASPRFRDKNKVFVIDIHSTNSVSEILHNNRSKLWQSSDEGNRSDTIASSLILKKTTMIIATTAQNESILVPSLAKNIKENPKLELFEMYLKICDDFNEGSDRVEYRNCNSGKFTFI